MLLLLSLWTAPLSCARQSEPACEVELVEAEPAIARVSWTATEPSVVFVDYGVGGYDLRTEPLEVEPGPVQILLPGLAGGQELQFELVSSSAAGSQTCAGSIRTERPPCALELVVTEEDPPETPSFRYLIGAQWGWGELGSLFILDRAGGALWCVAYEEGLSPYDALFAPDGDGILASQFAEDHEVDAGAIRRFALDGSEGEPVALPDGHHFFTQLPPETPDGAGGTFAYLAIDVRPWTDPDSGQTLSVVGDALVELAPDGGRRTVFSTWDVLEPTPGADWGFGFYPQGEDWTHANALQYLPATDRYLVSLGGLDAALEVDRASGALTRAFGSSALLEGMLTPDEQSRAFSRPHGVRLTEEGELTLFASSDGHYGGLRYAVDEEAGALREQAALGFELDVVSLALGQHLPLEGGGALLNYATGGVLVELDADGEVVWELRAENGIMFGDVHPLQTLPGLEP